MDANDRCCSHASQKDCSASWTDEYHQGRRGEGRRTCARLGPSPSRALSDRRYRSFQHGRRTDDKTVGLEARRREACHVPGLEDQRSPRRWDHASTGAQTFSTSLTVARLTDWDPCYRLIMLSIPVNHLQMETMVVGIRTGRGSTTSNLPPTSPSECMRKTSTAAFDYFGNCHGYFDMPFCPLTMECSQ